MSANNNTRVFLLFGGIIEDALSGRVISSDRDGWMGMAAWLHGCMVVHFDFHGRGQDIPLDAAFNVDQPIDSQPLFDRCHRFGAKEKVVVISTMGTELREVGCIAAYVEDHVTVAK
jgi:hypothetical protein